MEIRGVDLQGCEILNSQASHSVGSDIVDGLGSTKINASDHIPNNYFLGVLKHCYKILLSELDIADYPLESVTQGQIELNSITLDIVHLYPSSLFRIHHSS